NLTGSADRAHETVPDGAIHPVRCARENFAPSEDGFCVKFIQPHLVFEKAKQNRLGLGEGIRPSRIAIEQNPESDAGSHQRERNEKHWLEQLRDLKMRGLAVEITI